MNINSISILNPTFVITNNFSLKWRIFLRLFWTLCIFSIITLLVFYIFQVNSEISERYSIRDYGKILDKLSKENKNLGINSLQVNSFKNIEESLKNLNFEKAGKISYIQVLDNQVVVKQK